MSAGSIEYWPEPQRGITEAYRVLRPGGLACVIGPVYPTFWLSRFFADAWMLFPTEKEYIDWCVILSRPPLDPPGAPLHFPPQAHIIQARGAQRRPSACSRAVAAAGSRLLASGMSSCTALGPGGTAESADTA